MSLGLEIILRICFIIDVPLLDILDIYQALTVGSWLGHCDSRKTESVRPPSTPESAAPIFAALFAAGTSPS